jgi:hypothetical protein
MQDAAGFAADKIFPNIPSKNQGNLYYKYDRSDAWRDSFRKRAPGTESAGGGWKMTTDSFFCEKWSLHKLITEEDLANADEPINLDTDAAAYLGEQAMISREVNFAANFLATGSWTGIDHSVGDVQGTTASPNGNEVIQWDQSTSTPIENVKAYSDTIWLLTGKRPNTLAMGRQVWTKLSDHPDLVDRIKYGQNNNSPAIVARQAAASLFELDSIQVMDGIQVTSAENPDFETSMTTASIAGKKALLVYAAARPGIREVSGGYTFSWTGLLGAGQQGLRVKRWWDNDDSAWKIEGDMAYTQKKTCPDCGVLFFELVA